MSKETSPINEERIGMPPLCINLDRTLLATDILWELVLRLVKKHPYILFALPFWFLRGKAYATRKLAASISIDPATLPYRDEVISFLAKEKISGRTIMLVTTSYRQAAESIAQHLGLFDHVFARDDAVNLTGAKELESLECRFGYGRFECSGNSIADLPSCESGNGALLDAPSPATLTRASRLSAIQPMFSSRADRIHEVVKALRCYQWPKNILIFVPLLTSHKVLEGELIIKALAAFVAMSFCASSIYIINDFLDVEADRRHPTKRLRPFAAGTLSIPAGALLAALVCIGGIGLGLMLLPLQFIWLLLIYITLTISYSTILKSKIVADVIVLALLYTLRILIGGMAVAVPISPWLLALSVFLFLSLAFVKRYGEIEVLKTPIGVEIPGRGYVADDKEWMRTMGGTSGYLSILVLVLYINSHEVTALYSRPEILWFACPPLLYWISRVWLLAVRGNVQDDPLVFATKDRVSYVVASLVLLTIIAAL